MNHHPSQVPSDMTERRPRPLARSILGWMLVLSLVPLAVATVQGYHCASQAVTDTTRDDLQRVAVARAAQLRMWTQERLGQLRFLAGSAGLPPECEKECKCWDAVQPVRQACRLVELYGETLGEYESLAIYSEAGELQGSVGTEEGSQSHVGTPIPDHLQGEPVLLDHPATGDPHPLELHVGVKLMWPETEAAGYMIGRLSLRGAAQRLFADDSEGGRGERSRLIHLAGPAHDHADHEGGLRLPAEIWTAMAAGRSGSALWDGDDGREVVLGFASVPEMNVAVLVERDRKVALAWLPILAQRGMLVASVTAVLVLFFSGRLAGRLAAPLRVLANVARQISSGDVESRVPPLKDQEAREVGLALNEMLEDLQRSRRSVARNSALAAVGELSTSIAHEMRNPLSSVKLNLQALKKKVTGDPTDTELADIAEQQVDRIERMLGDLLAYAKPLAVVARRSSLAGILSSAEAAVQGVASERRVELQTQLPEPDLVLDTDPDRLCQVLENLLRNAIEASPPGATVELRAGRHPNRVGHALLEIRDQGPGLPGGGQDRLFRPFFTTKPGGTGLGLANARKIVNLLDGTVEAHDLDQGGAAFRVDLPRLVEP